MTKHDQPDFIIHAGEWATMWGFEPCNDTARNFISDSVSIEDWAWTGSRFYVDHRPARDLARYLAKEGFVLMHPHYGYFQG